MTRLFMTADAVGGVWHYALELAGALAPLGYDTVLALVGPAPSDDQRALAARVPGLRLVETRLTLDWMARGPEEVRDTAGALAGLAHAESADLIQLNQPAFAVAPMPAPTVAVMHSCVATWWRAAGQGAMPESFAWQTALVRAGLARADSIVCPSGAFADEVGDTYGLRMRPHVVYNGRTARGTGSEPPRDFAFNAGRLWDPAKNVATLDRAAALLAIPVEVAGALAGPESQVVRLEHAHALGQLGDMALVHRLAARPVFVSTALYEPFGLAVLEAAQAGCALVLSDIPTFRELWGDVASFVAPHDAHGFAKAIERLIDDRPFRLAQGERACARAATYTPQAMADAMAAVYASLAQRAAA